MLGLDLRIKLQSFWQFNTLLQVIRDRGGAAFSTPPPEEADKKPPASSDGLVADQQEEEEKPKGSEQELDVVEHDQV